ncbi:MAG TPA: DUF2330 domain-containing protein [Terriglobia bacterium]|nr:DUF2330 domain-containing protein [Terriglobia bacterium]
MRLKRWALISLAIAAMVWSAQALVAFCGFYVAKVDARLFNQASQVVLVRDGDRTILTMSNDFRGEPKEFAMVVPVPSVLRRDQIQVSDRDLLEHVDAYSAPRLVEYFDPNPCQAPRGRGAGAAGGGGGGGRGGGAAPAAENSLGVKIEAQYTVGEYDILILSAVESTGLETWLRQNGYRIPRGAADVLASYIMQNMKFFVARVNLEQQSRLGFTSLRPIRVEFDSPKFMLPIRLGMVNADGPQELLVYTVTRQGRVETTNYRTVKLPTGMDIPPFVRGRFGEFYKAMFSEQAKRAENRAVFTEYAWDMGFCDPCAANPLSPDELRKLGVFWLADTPAAGPRGQLAAPRQQVFLTRLHVRYDNAHFPEDLVFQQTADRQNYQGRYVLRYPWNGGDSCAAAVTYRQGLPARYEREAQQLADLTGWNIGDIRRWNTDDIRRRMGIAELVR